MSEDADARRLAEVSARYAAERAKRISGGREFTNLTGTLARHLDDPGRPVAGREPVSANFDIVIIGAGLCGLCAAAELRKAGAERICIVDSAGDFGGVWYWNRYPGAMCDIESYIYMPYLEELDYVPTAKYSHADEIFTHLQRVARKYDLYQDAYFHTTVEEARWDAASQHWIVATNRGDELRGKFIMLANGALTTPQVPAVPGIETFEGPIFHTSRWDFAYTGGDNRGGLDRLGDQVVGVIGTGATALQCVPHLAEWARHLYVFQRTPSTVGLRANRPTDPAWARSLGPGWQAERQLNYARCIEGKPVDVDLVDDGWTWTSRAQRVDQSDGPLSADEIRRRKLVNDLKLMESLRDRVRELVKDPGTAAALMPFYPYACKRPGFHDEYLPAFNRDNVTLVDTSSQGIEAITPHGLVTSAAEYALDSIIFATGFTGTPTAPRTGFDVIGADGIPLVKSWEPGVGTLYGVVSRGFPNMFLTPFPHMGQGAHPNNYTHMSLMVGLTVARVVAAMRARGLAAFDVEASAQEAWVSKIVELNPDDPEFLSQCTPGRGNNEGHFDKVPRQNTNYGGGGLAYFGILERWCSDAIPAGLLVTAAPEEGTA